MPKEMKDWRTKEKKETHCKCGRKYPQRDRGKVQECEYCKIHKKGKLAA